MALLLSFFFFYPFKRKRKRERERTLRKVIVFIHICGRTWKRRVTIRHLSYDIGIVLSLILSLQKRGKKGQKEDSTKGKRLWSPFEHQYYCYFSFFSPFKKMSVRDKDMTVFDSCKEMLMRKIEFIPFHSVSFALSFLFFISFFYWERERKVERYSIIVQKMILCDSLF